MAKKRIQAKDRIGTKINLLTILEVKYQNRRLDGCRESIALCKCDCGVVREINLNSVVTSNTKSCGCLIVIRKRGFESNNYRHGLTKSKAWKLWSSIKRRCQTSSASGYYKYGARGVTVCDRWSNSFEAFLEDMGEPPQGMSIDRIDNSKGYSKENCRWATIKEQANNRTSNLFFTILGETKTLVQWVEVYKPKYDIKYATVRNRIYRGWKIEDALTQPLLSPKRQDSYRK